MLVVSTGEVYGRAEEIPTTEDAPVAPLSPYAASKAAAEVAAGQAQQAGLDVVVARAFQHEGPGRDERFAVGSWSAPIVRAEEAGGGAVQVGDLTARRDITDVRDVVRAYEALLDPSVPAGTYNVASGRAVEMQRCSTSSSASPRARSKSSETRSACAPQSSPSWRRCLPLADGNRLDAYDFPRADAGGHAAGRPGCLERMASA